MLSPEARALAAQVPPLRTRVLVIVVCAAVMILVAAILAKAGLIP
jgi:hypothetical protein